MDAFWDTSCITASTNDVEHMTSLGLESNISTAAKERTFYYHRGIRSSGNDGLILVLLHGYPQTSFLWRHVVSRLPSNVPLFIPDLPGYGRSSPLSVPHDKRNCGGAVLKALRSLLGHSNKQSVIIAGHDRGARICHRLAVDERLHDNFEIRGTIFLDIIPTLVQWKSFGSAPSVVGSYHWPFLANVQIATELIKGLGGDSYIRMCLDRWAGKNETGTASFKENNAMAVYEESFKYESVIMASCDDYRAGAEEDIRLQEEDQKAGRKIDIDTLVLFSAGYLGRRYDLREVWQEWMGKGKLEVAGFGDGFGHFIAEEAPDGVASALLSFYETRA